MQQDPYASIARPVGQADPYAGIAAPVAAARAPARQAAPRRPQSAPRVASPGTAQSAPLNDLGISDSEERDALIYQGYSPEQADAFMAENAPTQAQPGYGILRSEDISPQEAERLIASGEYQRDPATGNVFRYVEPPVPAIPAAPVAPKEPSGYDLARADEERKNDLLGGPREVSFTDQLTAPINDEIGWAAGYGMQGLDNLLRRMTGRDVEIGAIDRARALRDIANEGQSQYERDKPVQALAGGLLGGFAFAPAKLATVPGVLGRLGQAGSVGAAYGAAEGDGITGRAGSAALSGGLSLATAGLLEGGGALVSRVGQGNAQRAAEAVGLGATGPERRVTGALGRALERDQMTPQQYLDSLTNAPEGRLPFQSGGENLLGLAETMATAPGNARRMLVGAVEGQRDGASNRVTARLAEGFGAQGNGFQALRQQVAARGEAANTGMGEIADAVVALDDQAVQALRSRLSSRAVRDAAEEAIAELTPEGSAAANRLFGLGERLSDMPAGANITVREAQDISYALKEAAGRAYRGGFNSRGEALQTLSNAIRTNARTPERGGVQAYDDWLKSFGDASEAIEGQRVGQNIFATANEKNAMSAAELSERWSKWSEPARQNFRIGVGEAVLDRVRGNGGVAAMRRLIRDNEIADRIRVAFNDEDAFLAFMRSADDEVSMANTGNQVIGGSPTARRAAGRADVEAQGFDPLSLVEAAADFTNPVGAGRQAIRLAAKNLPRADRSIIGDEELNGLLGAALSDEAAMTRLLNLMQTQEGLQARVAAQARRFGLLSTPGAVAGGQERARGLLTTSP
jgi:hypothetical protein